ncbi:hypothetical protein Sru01_05220 [Sphaerisporangium rufum]|uniref:Barstar (barnase inhibitor) domain-containing protein n=1 Tax=Sphaerisporangium rufum TaxID=1381558 RepID=A0A919V2R0_9ACTN|nr:barstar family protein [Sphaerisporangium rufum]GII75540.1 hypothetical protein Sru01_05220 [Sphaerisporangium rufum]
MNFQVYVLVNEEYGDVVVAAEEIEGFFVAPEAENSKVVFHGVSEVSEERTVIEEGVLKIVDFRRQKVGEYYIGRVILGEREAGSPGGPATRVPCRFFGDRCDCPGAAKVWRRWAMGGIVEGEWLRWPAIEHCSWLHVVQNAWFTAGHRAARYGANDIVYLNGSNIYNKASFYCAFGEAVNGPGGYMGSNLDAMADCMSSNCGDGALAKIIWRDFEVSQRLLECSFVEAILDIMHEKQVDVDAC